MRKHADALILWELLNSDRILTGQQLAMRTGLSRRTISNHMPQVRQRALQEGLTLTVIRGRGIQVKCEEARRPALLEKLEALREPPVFEQERILITLFWLLTYPGCLSD